MIDSTNGCYILMEDGRKIPIKRTLARAIEKFLALSPEGTGAVIINIKSGGASNIELRAFVTE